MKDRATLMMVTFNRLDLTEKTINVILENTKYPFNLCIVDNGSKDKTVDFLKKFLPSVLNDVFLDFIIIENKENRGIAVGRNQALIGSKKWNDKWLATIDNDIWVPTEWLNECIKILSLNKQYGSIGVNMEGVKYPNISFKDIIFQNKQTGNLGSACMVFPRSLHKMLGYFNSKDYSFYGMEDSDWGMRIRAIGLKLGYIEEMGKHIGEGENDQGEYREFKDKWHAANLNKFFKNANEYMRKTKSHYVDFKDD